MRTFFQCMPTRFAMKHLFYAIFTLLLLSTASCIEDGFATGSGDVLEFSTDTLSFDTVFTGETTATKRFVVYNRHKKQLRIERIFLTGAPEGAEFYLNVDGRSGKEFSDIEVRGEDSIYVFVEARIDATDADLPFDVFDHLNFVTNGTQQSVVIRAAGQNAVAAAAVGHIAVPAVLLGELAYLLHDAPRRSRAAQHRVDLYQCFHLPAKFWNSCIHRAMTASSE